MTKIQESLAPPLPSFPPFPLPLSPFSPQYGAFILGSSQPSLPSLPSLSSLSSLPSPPSPPSLQQPQVFTFEPSSFLVMEEPGEVPWQQHLPHLQPLTPLSPGPAPAFYFPPSPAPAVLTSGLSVASNSSENSGHRFFSSPCKEFVRFKVGWNMITEA